MPTVRAVRGAAKAGATRMTPPATTSGAPEPGDPTPTPRTLAEKLDQCFRTMHPADRGEWSYKEVSAGMAELGVTCSPSYLWQLRKGLRDNPTVRQVEALARYFHVPVTFFFGSTQEVDQIAAQMALVQALRDPQLHEIALRASTFTPAGLRAVAGVIRELQAVPGMANTPGRRSRSPEPSVGGNAQEIPSAPDSSRNLEAGRDEP